MVISQRPADFDFAEKKQGQNSANDVIQDV